MTSTKRKVANAILNILALPLRAIYGFFKAVFMPPKTESGWKQPVGFWWQDKKGKWHPKVYMYSRTEPPPSA